MAKNRNKFPQLFQLTLQEITIVNINELQCMLGRASSLLWLETEHIPVQMLIDSGASVNVLDLETYHRLKARKGIQLMPSTLRVYAYSSTTPLNILGTVSGRVKCNSAEIVAKFVVVHNQHAGCLLWRQTVSWPTMTLQLPPSCVSRSTGIDKDVEHLIRSCISCQAQSSQSCPQPLTMTEMLSRPWTVLHADLCGPFHSGESLLVLVDWHHTPSSNTLLATSQF